MILAAMALAAAAPYELISSGPQGQMTALPYPSLEECQRAQLLVVQDWQRRTFAAEYVRRRPPTDSPWDQATVCVPAGSLTKESRRLTRELWGASDWGQAPLHFTDPY
jgi:hypothetical protein